MKKTSPTLVLGALALLAMPLAMAPSAYARPVSSSVHAQTQLAAPVVTGSVANGRVSLSWGAVPGAAKYQVLRDGRLTATVTRPGWSGPVGATVSEYRVRAVSKLAELSLQSDPVRASTAGVEKPAPSTTPPTTAKAAVSAVTTAPSAAAALDQAPTVPIEPLGPVGTPRLPVTTRDGRGDPVTVTSIDRIVVLGGDASEILYSLGLNDKVVGNDLSSLFPDAVAAKPKVGIFSNFSAEGVLKLQPTVVFAQPTAGPPAAVAAVKAAGIPWFTVVQPNEPSGATTKIRAIASTLGLSADGDRLADYVGAQMTAARAKATTIAHPPVVAYMTYRGNNLYLFGRDSDPCQIIVEVGGICAGTTVGLLENATIITPEVMLRAKPDLIIAPTDAVAALGGLNAFKALPAVAATPAAQKGNVFTFDVNFSQGFGPRTGKALLEYNRLIASFAG